VSYGAPPDNSQILGLTNARLYGIKNVDELSIAALS
jgi:hypothetical protein